MATTVRNAPKPNIDSTALGLSHTCTALKARCCYRLSNRSSSTAGRVTRPLHRGKCILICVSTEYVLRVGSSNLKYPPRPSSNSLRFSILAQQSFHTNFDCDFAVPISRVDDDGYKYQKHIE